MPYSDEATSQPRNASAATIFMYCQHFSMSSLSLLCNYGFTKKVETLLLDFAGFILILFQAGHAIPGLKYLHKVKQKPKAWHKLVPIHISEVGV